MILRLLTQTDAVKEWRIGWGRKRSSRLWVIALLQLCGTVALANPTQVMRPHVVVAVIDTGVDVHHPILSPQLWINAGEQGLDHEGKDKASNGRDDDANGFVDDVHGWDFVRQSPQIQDSHGHGTHVAGLIAKSDARVRIMPLRFYSQSGGGMSNLKNTIRAIEYAVKMKVDIINYSGGGIESSLIEEQALRLAQQAGILVVAAAGNEGTSTERLKFFPAGYGLGHILSVAALSPDGELSDVSNFGRDVGIAALGENVLSSLPAGKMGLMTGTSQATAIVTGAVASWLAHRGLKKRPRPEAIIQHFSESGDYEPRLANRTQRATRLNLERALKMKSESEVPIWNQNEIDPRIFSSNLNILEMALTRKPYD